MWDESPAPQEPTADINVRKDVVALPFDGGLVLLDPVNSTIRAYNESAAAVWHVLEAGATTQDAACVLAETYAIAMNQAARDVNAIIAHWRAQNLIGGAPAAALPAPRAPHRLSPPATPFFVALRAHRFRIAIQDEAAARFVTRILAPFTTAPNGSDTHIDLERCDDGMLVLRIDGVERLRTADSAEAIGAVFQAMLEALHGAPDWLAIAHASGVYRAGRAFVLAGPSGSGKSTLAAHLSAHGYVYASDDIAALGAPGGLLMPWPVPRSLKRGSWNVLAADFPELAASPPVAYGSKDIKYLAAGPSAWDEAPRPVAHILFPQFEAGAPATLQALRPLEVLQRLLHDRIWLGNPPTRAGIERFLRWLEHTPAWHIRYGALQEARALVDGL